MLIAPNIYIIYSIAYRISSNYRDIAKIMLLSHTLCGVVVTKLRGTETDLVSCDCCWPKGGLKCVCMCVCVCQVTDSQGKDTETAGGLDLSLKTPGNVSQLFLLCHKAIQTTHFTC